MPIDEHQNRVLYEVVSQLDFGICCAAPDGRLVYANSAAIKIFGVASVDLRVKSWPSVFGLIDPRTGKLFRLEDLPLHRALRGEWVRDVEIEIRTERILGDVISVNAHPLITPAGVNLGALCTFHDITTRKRHENALRASEWQKAAILDHVPFATWLKDREGRYIAVNEAFTAISHIDRAEAVGRSDAELWDRKRALLFSHGDARVMATERPYREEQDLEEEPFRITAEILKSPLYDPDGVLVGTIGLARDVTAERQAERALLRANEELETRVEERTRELERVQQSLVRQERLAALGQLAGGVAHQMRNPLSAITSASYVLRRHVGADASPDVKLALEIIFEEARHANDIITGLLDYTRTRAAIVRDSDVTTLIERALAKTRGSSAIRIELSIPVELRVTVDVEQVTSALSNLIDNAFDAMASGGILSIVAQAHAEPRPGCFGETSASTSRTGDSAVTPAPRTSEFPVATTDFIHITITDTGSGISPDRRSELFSPLFTTKPLGLGLGLVTARTLIERQGGALEYVPSDANRRGATFVVRLPAGVLDEAAG